jgi:hypothetical protein
LDGHRQKEQFEIGLRSIQAQIHWKVLRPGRGFVGLFFFSSSLLTGCVTTPQGQKKFGPWEGGATS